MCIRDNFKRNDAMLAVMPIGVLIFPGTGIQDNLADKARMLGIPVYRFGKAGASANGISSFSRVPPEGLSAFPFRGR